MSYFYAETREAPPSAEDLARIAEPLRYLAFPCAALALDPRNARAHGEGNLAVIAASLSRFVQRKALVVRRAGLVVEAGNGTLERARALGWRYVAATILDDDEDTANAYALVDNKSAELATWDAVNLKATVVELDAHEVSLTGLGWTPDEIADLLAPEEDVPPVEPPTPGDEGDADSQVGVVYLLGPHRVMCGDSTRADHVALALGGAEPRLMVTDQPYGVDYTPGWREEYEEERRSKGQWRGLSSVTDVVENDDRCDWREAWELVPFVHVAYVWVASLKIPEGVESLRACGFEWRSLIVGNKSMHQISRGHYHWKHETCLYMVRKGRPAGWQGDRKQNTVWDIPTPSGFASGRGGDPGKVHPTRKPVECMTRAIANHAGDVYDPFLGSGTTLIAAAERGRTCYGLELTRRYCDVIRKRWTTWAEGRGVDPGPGALR